AVSAQAAPGPEQARPLPEPFPGTGFPPGAAQVPGTGMPYPGLGPTAAPAPPGTVGGLSTRTFFKALGRRWPLAVGLGLVLAAGAAAAAWVLLPAKHNAYVQVRVAYTPPWIFAPFADTSESQNQYDTYKRLQVAAIRSRFVLLHALKKPEVKRLRIVRE